MPTSKNVLADVATAYQGYVPGKGEIFFSVLLCTEIDSLWIRIYTAQGVLCESSTAFASVQRCTLSKAGVKT
jgi:hypothetical protein